MATYKDGPLVFSSYEKLQTVAEVCVPHFPLCNVSTAIATEDPTKNIATLEERAMHMWIQQFSGFAKVQCLVVWCDHSIQGCRDHVPCGSAVDVTFSSHCVGSPHFSLLEQQHSLNAELPDYVTATQDVVVASEEEKVKWWYPQVERLSCWSAPVRQVLLVQPSSAATERAFSSLLAAFRHQQDSALADYLEASKILQYNEHLCWLVYTILLNVFSSNYFVAW